jgi:hypothetical protein
MVVSLLEKQLFVLVLNPISTGYQTGIVHPVLMWRAHLYRVPAPVLMCLASTSPLSLPFSFFLSFYFLFFSHPITSRFVG